MTGRVRVAAPAKVNLRLRVLAREASGYHGLETLFCALTLADDVVAARTERLGISLSVDGTAPTAAPRENLVVRAAEEYEAALRRPLAVHLHLTKRIPTAAGLGGGSSDAAAALRALNTLHGEPLDTCALLQIAARLGSDVPFFLCGSPLAWAWNRGDRLLALPPLPARPVLVAHPGTAMPTAAAFAELARRRVEDAGALPPTVLTAAQLASWEGVAALAANDFEPIALHALPVLAAARDAMRTAGAEIVLLAGSGAALFGIFTEPAARDAAERAVAALGLRTWAAETRADVPAPQVDPAAAHV